MSKALYHGFMMLFCLIIYIPASWSAPAWSASGLLVLGMFEASMMFWHARKEWEASDNKSAVVIDPSMWLCPHCLQDGNRIVLTAGHPEELGALRYDHMKDHHREILDREIFG